MAKITKDKDKRFIVRKYVMARSAQDALRKEKKHVPDEVFVDEEWAKGKEFESAIGYHTVEVGRFKGEMEARKKGRKGSAHR